MTIEEAALKANELSSKNDWYVSKSIQPFQKSLIEYCSVHVDGYAAVNMASFESAFISIKQQIKNGDDELTSMRDKVIELTERLKKFENGNDAA